MRWNGLTLKTKNQKVLKWSFWILTKVSLWVASIHLESQNRQFLGLLVQSVIRDLK
nr:MAG TPA: hypothetical protein [Caudoviricetes sp.]